jgi:hypothetical protein
MIEAEIARGAGRLNESVDSLDRARKFADLWLGRFLMAATNVDAGRFPLAQPDLELCLKRRGEAMALFLDDVPTFRYLAPLPYWLARAQHGLGSTAAAAENYRAFLARRSTAGDALADDARKRLEALTP